MTEREGSYNGWTNYETWAVSMWLDGNYDGPGVYHDTIRTVQAALVTLNHPTSEYWTVEESRRYAVRDALEQWTRGCETLGASLAADLLGSALDSVDWYELADAWIANLAEITEPCNV